MNGPGNGSPHDPHISPHCPYLAALMTMWLSVMLEAPSALITGSTQPCKCGRGARGTRENKGGEGDARG